MTPVRPRLRISGGDWRGRRFESPPEQRPTQERVREALFSRWSARISGASLLELYAGSGAVALEALSRGARRAVAVDRAVAVLERNRLALHAQALEIVKAALPSALAREPLATAGPFDLVFADPPYGEGDAAELLAVLSPLLALGGELALEHAQRDPVPEHGGSLELYEKRSYGETVLSFYRGRDPGRGAGTDL